MNNNDEINVFHKRSINGKKGNVFTRLDRLEDEFERIAKKNITNFVTQVIQANQQYILPSVLGGITDPTDPAFTGVIVSPQGVLMPDGIIYTFALVENGVIITGLGDDGGVSSIIGGGDVYGPASSTAYGIAVFADATGKLLADLALTYYDVLNKGQLFYFDNTASDIGGYKSLGADFTAVTSGSVNKVCTAIPDVPELIEEFISPAIDTTVLFRGQAYASLYVSANVDQDVYISIAAFTRDGGGVETAWGQGTVGSGPYPVTATPTAFPFLVGEIFEGLLPASTDRLVLKVYVNVSADSTITITYGSDTRPSYYTASLPATTGGGGGDVVGPASAIDNNVAVFDGITGKLIKDSGVSLYADGDENLYLAPVFPADLTTGTKNIAIGSAAGADITDGDSNVAIGINALGTNLNGNNNVALGENTLHNGNGSNNIGIGGSAGYYETGSNKFFIDSRNRTNEAGGRTGAIIYGVMDDNSALQELTINGNLTVTGTITPSPGGLSHGQVMARISIGF